MNENQIVVYQPNANIRLDVCLENETVWQNRHQMAQLFGRDIKTIGKHIANALSEELADDKGVAIFAPTPRPSRPTVEQSAQDETPQNQVVENVRQLPPTGKSIKSNITVWTWLCPLGIA